MKRITLTQDQQDALNYLLSEFYFTADDGETVIPHVSDFCPIDRSIAAGFAKSFAEIYTMCSGTSQSAELFLI